MSGNRGLRSAAKAAGPRNTAGREGSRAAALTTGSAWIRSPSQFGRRRRSGRAIGRALRDDAQLAADVAQDGERQIQVLVGVGRGDDRAEARLPLRDGGISDPLREDAPLEEPVG